MRRVQAMVCMATLPLLVTALPAAADPAARSTADVYMLGGGDVTGWSTLVRTDSRVSTSVHASDLPGGDATTLWWVIFNDPARCSDGSCGADDIFNDPGDPSAGLNRDQIDAVGISSLFATGHVVGKSGKATYSDGLRVGEEREDPLDGPGLTNPRGAEIHLVVRTHGEADPQQTNEQISTFNAGCNPECVNLQASVHLAP